MNGGTTMGMAVSERVGAAHVGEPGEVVLSVRGLTTTFVGRGGAVPAVRGVDFLRKSAMQLASKMRFVSAQFDALLAGDLWLRNASHANAMARRLEAAVRDIPGVAIQRPVQANSVFVVIPPAVTERLQKQYPFYVWDEQTGEVRWMTSFDTTEQDVDGFAAALSAEMGAA